MPEAGLLLGTKAPHGPLQHRQNFVFLFTAGNMHVMIANVIVVVIIVTYRHIHKQSCQS